MEKKNLDVTSQFEAEAMSNALGDLDQYQMARFQSTKNQNLRGKTFNMLDSALDNDGLEPGNRVEGDQLDSDEDGEIVREASDMPGDSFFQSGGLDIGEVRLSQPNLGGNYDANG